MNYNYHTHTYRCSHATGSEEEYINRAIDCGIKHMGFSEHIPLVLSDGTQSFYRLPMEEVKDYFNVIKYLKEKYKDKININIGFEMEYYKDCFHVMYNTAKESGAEYLILGQHCHIPENTPGAVYSTSGTDSEEILSSHVESVVEAIKTGVFTYVAHPDIFLFLGDRNVLREQWRKIAVASRMYNTPLEINFLGIRQGRPYPDEMFWELAGEEKSPVTFGFDSHDVLNACDEKSLPVAKKLVEKYNLNYIGKPVLKPLK